MATLQDIRDQLFSFRNVVCHAALSCVFPDLIIPSLLTMGRCAPALFPAALGRFHITGCTISVFAGGKCMIMGSTSEYDSHLAIVLLADMINRCIPGMNARVIMFRVVNRVASVKLGFDLDIERFTQDWKSMGLWEPTSFPGMKLCINDLGCTFVIFPKDSKVNVAGDYHPKMLPAIAQRVGMLRNYQL
jgi:TATA-box binding protein (TBP) (component of TFIID and TFIIIB)